ncbi:hypothetical protein AAG604_12125 [Citromicrobium bathyomarinum]|uniref:hypothetical protein n=1 Tax=Citromicrobium sp. WPS32 TaxID=1634517 RepID=UPI0006C8FC64|nr:hypothetical protein [Citromicrobium sp. WPS32]
MISFSEAMTDPQLFGPWFEGDSWACHHVLAKAMFGEPLDADELAIFTELTGLAKAPAEPCSEAWIIAGRRSGKDVFAAALVAWMAAIWAESAGLTKRLQRGERGVVQLLAVDREQAKVCLNYVRGYFEQPLLAQMVAKIAADGLELTNGLAIEITTNNLRRVRGRTVLAAVFDEVAFFAAEGSVSPDVDVYNAVKPAMATIPEAMLIGISSPYARRGLLFKKWKSHYGKPGRTLVVQGPTWVFNPTIPRDGEFLTAAFNDDPVTAASEYGAQWRSDIEAFIAREVVEACVSPGIYERAAVPGVLYKGFVDPSGGSADSMTLAIAHSETDPEGNSIAVLDAVREVKPPFSPDAVVAEFCDVLKSYACASVTGDRFGGEFAREPFRKHGIDYELSEKVRSDLYRELLPALNSGRADLLDHEKLVNQIVSLERRVPRSGKESIDHAPGAHDDLANAVAGAIWLAIENKSRGSAWVAIRSRNRKSPAQDQRSYIA